MCEAEQLADKWPHHTQDREGFGFSFLWRLLDENSAPAWHPLYKGAMQWIKRAVMSTTQD